MPTTQKMADRVLTVEGMSVRPMGCRNIVQEDGLIDDVGARQELRVSDGSWRFGVGKQD